MRFGAASSSSRVRRRNRQVSLSLGGLVYVGMMLFMGLAAINTQANLLFGVFGLMLGVLILAWHIGRLVLKRLNVRRVLPPHAVVGTGAVVEYHFTNEKRVWPSLSVGITELDGIAGLASAPRCYMLHAAAGMTASVPTEVLPRRRGLYQLEQYRLATSFPFGFIRRSRLGAQRDTLLIFPPIGIVERRLLSLCRSADDTGESVRPTPGGADEFYGIRRYRPGDTPRHIYWRRSARTGILLTKEMTRASPPRLLLVVDTFLQDPTPQQLADLERAIAMAASLASAAVEDGLSVGICAWAGEPLVIAPSRGKQQREEILALLARLPVNSKYQRAALLEDCRSALKPDTTTVLFTAANISLDFLEEAKGSVLLLSAANADARRWFHFPPEIDFAKCCPVERGKEQ